MKRRVLAMFLTFTLLLIACPVNASASPLSIDEELIQRGYPDHLIAGMLNSEKEDLIINDCYFETSTTYYYDEEGKIIDTPSADESGIAPFGSIKPTTLNFTIYSSKSGRNKKITIKYFWTQSPVNRYEDPIAVSWDQNIFSYLSKSFYKEDQYCYILNGPTYVHDSSNSYAKGNLSYIAWYADLKGYIPPPEAVFGYGTFTLVPKQTGKSTKIYAQYTHAKTSLGISVGFNGIDFTISGASTYDYMTTDIDIVS